MELTEDFAKDDKVKHVKFGQGVVVARLGGDDNPKVVVKFGAEVGEKKLALKYANLKKISERPTLAAVPGENPPPAEE